MLTPEMNFCPICGQENHELNVPFHHFFIEVIEGLFHFETKFLTTVKTVFTKPGQITKDFVNGKRARFVPPLRLYFFVAFFFFLYLNDIIEGQVLSTKADAAAKVEAKSKESEKQKIEKFDLDKSLEQLYALGHQENEVFEENLRKLDIKRQMQKIDSLKFNAINTILSKNASKVSYKVRDQIISNVNPSDSMLLKKAGFNFNTNVEEFDLSWEIRQLTKIGVYQVDDKDSLYQFYEALTPAQILNKTWQLKNQSLNDSLLKYGKGKLPKAYKEILLNNFFASSSQKDSIFLNRAGLTAAEMASNNSAENSGMSLFGVKLNKADLEMASSYSDKQIDSVLNHSEEFKKLGSLTKSFVRKAVVQIAKISKGQKADNSIAGVIYQNLIHSITKYISLTMFLMMPIVGLLLLWIFYRQNKYYYEHVIFSIHGHTVLFFFMTLEFMYIYYFSKAEFSYFSVLIGVAYFFVSLKTVYGQTWWKTFVKFWLVIFSYGFIAVFMLAIASGIGFLTF